MTKVAAAVLFLMLNAYVYHFFASEEVIPPRRTLDEFPLELGDWRCERPEQIAPGIIGNLGVTDYLACTFVRKEPFGRVSVYVGYHSSQIRKSGGGSHGVSIHPPKHCLPGSGWNILETRLAQLDLPGFSEDEARVNRLIIAHGSRRQIVYYWYHSRGRIIAEDWRKIVMLFWDRARLQRTDGSLVRFTVPLARGNERDVDLADEAFSDLASQILPRLAAYIPE
jgi:EpsI family protein